MQYFSLGLQSASFFRDWRIKKLTVAEEFKRVVANMDLKNKDLTYWVASGFEVLFCYITHFILWYGEIISREMLSLAEMKPVFDTSLSGHHFPTPKTDIFSFHSTANQPPQQSWNLGIYSIIFCHEGDVECRSYSIISCQEIDVTPTQSLSWGYIGNKTYV